MAKPDDNRKTVPTVDPALAQTAPGGAALPRVAEEPPKAEPTVADFRLDELLSSQSTMKASKAELDALRARAARDDDAPASPPPVIAPLEKTQNVPIAVAKPKAKPGPMTIALQNLPDAFGPSDSDASSTPGAGSTQVTKQHTAPEAAPAPVPASKVPSGAKRPPPVDLEPEPTVEGRKGRTVAESDIVETSAVTGGWTGIAPLQPEDTSTGGRLDAHASDFSDSTGSNKALSAEENWGDGEDSSGWGSISGPKVRRGKREVSQTDAAREVTDSPSSDVDRGPLAQQRTGVFDKKADAASAAQGARLVCLRGKDEGQEFPVRDGEITIGRDPRNGVVLVEGSVSRHHATIHNDGNQYTLIDNNSGNGTYVNGERVDRARLRSGDEVGFGNAAFRFLEVGDVFKPVDAAGAPVLPGARRPTVEFFAGRKGMLAAASVVIMCAVVVVTVLVLRSGGEKPAPEVTFRYYMAGVDAFKRRQWAQAETQFTLMLGHDPEHQRGQRYLKAVASEREAETRLTQAKKARTAGDVVRASAELQAIRNSVYAEEARGLMREISVELDGRVSTARRALEAGRPREAYDTLMLVEQARPGRPDVAGLLHRAAREAGLTPPEPGPPQGAPTEPKSTPSAAASPGPAASAPPPTPASSSLSSAPSAGTAPAPAPATAKPEEDDEGEEDGPEEREKPSDDPAINQARQLFGVGKLSDAVALLDKAKDQRAAVVIKKKIDKFKAIYAQALTEHRAKKTATAIKKLKQAKGYEAKITGGGTPLSKEIQRKLADMYYIDGVKSLAGKDYPDAYKNFRQALAVCPDHSLTQQKMVDLEKVAKKLYEDGYAASGAGDAAGAAKLFKLVTQMLPPDHEYFKKAKSRLK